MEISDDHIRSAIEAHRKALHARIAELQQSQQRLQKTLGDIQDAAPLPGWPLPARQAAVAAPRADHVLPQLLAIQEQERRRIARELHDEMGQSLAALLLELKLLEHSSDDNRLGARLRQLQSLTEKMCLAVRELMVRLRPVELDEVGLQEALVQHLDAWSERTGIEADFHFGPLIAQRLTDEIESAVYRVVQEALTNVLKHAHAKRVSVVITERNGQLNAIVEDDGHGFDVQTTHPRNKLGLLGMRERLAALGGELELESSPGQGTTLYARIPLSAPKMEDNA